MNLLQSSRSLFTVISVLAVAVVAQANPMTNGDFNSGSGSTTLAGVSPNDGYPASAATGWNHWNNHSGTTTVSVLPTTDPAGTGSMIRITTDVGDSGIYQVYDYNTNTGSVDVFVLSGQVTFHLYNGNSSISVSSTLHNQWETLTLGAFGNNEFVIYSSADGGADFYVDRASLPAGAAIDTNTSNVPDGGASITVLGLLIPVGLGLLRKRR